MTNANEIHIKRIVPITLTSEFHGTKTVIHVNLDYPFMSNLQILRARRKLCGTDFCTCGLDPALAQALKDA